MASVKLNCPKCMGTGLTGDVVETRCSQCSGTGTITVNDSDTITTVHSGSSAPFVVTKATTVPQSAVKNLSRGK